MRIQRNKGIPTQLQRAYITAENEAYEDLVNYGYRPQGYDFETKKHVVCKVENEHRSNEVKEFYYFEDWQESKENLCKDGVLNAK